MRTGIVMASTLPFANVWGLNQLKAKEAKTELSITQPDDWHLHLRDGDLFEVVISHSAFHFGREIVMPNLKPPIKTTAAAVAYRESILKALPANSDFIPLMTLYLTDTTTHEEIKLASDLYLFGATTNSQDGVTDLFGKCIPVLEEMVKHNMPLLVHGEVTDPEVDIFYRERVVIDTVLRPLIQKFPQLKVVMEHVTTADAVRFVESCNEGPDDGSSPVVRDSMGNAERVPTGPPPSSSGVVDVPSDLEGVERHNWPFSSLKAGLGPRPDDGSSPVVRDSMGNAERVSIGPPLSSGGVVDVPSDLEGVERHVDEVMEQRPNIVSLSESQLQ
ncbi:hypothetical protein LOK49_LG07G02174 [Camellia lanceoleosa]|uniref:Uncharacterized protein n=1 Tax=Camellia lanceoleosa TaxID=1840588 RepID=A0ACC0H662_9ERIC|nr:hypothetical protein LOK49_LG07G02174 [Camellia lanceoleosa]